MMVPNANFTPEECVAAQLDALAMCDNPWPNHGIQTAYGFGYDIGGLEPSMYFGFRKDLYHLDHFMGMFQTRLPELVRLSEYRIIGAEDIDGNPEAFAVHIEVLDASARKEAKFTFYLRRKHIGSRKGALMTERIQRITYN